VLIIWIWRFVDRVRTDTHTHSSMNEALLTEASPRSRAHRVRLRDPPDTFLLELEFDFWVLTMIWITVQFNFAWMVGQQLDGALRSSVTARCVSLVSGQALNKLILTIGVRACLQHAVRRQRLSSSRARLVIIGCLVIEALCDDLLEVWNFGLPPLSARSAPLKPVRTGSDSFSFGTFTPSTTSRPEFRDGAWRLASSRSSWSCS
jgi:hypothetical protein